MHDICVVSLYRWVQCGAEYCKAKGRKRILINPRDQERRISHRGGPIFPSSASFSLSGQVSVLQSGDSSRSGPVNFDDIEVDATNSISKVEIAITTELNSVDGNLQDETVGNVLDWIDISTSLNGGGASLQTPDLWQQIELIQNQGLMDSRTFYGNGVDPIGLEIHRTYYVSVRATDAAGNTSNTLDSDGFKIFSPSSLENLVLWYDLEDAETVFANSDCTQASEEGGVIGCVFDKSGNLNHGVQSVESRRPLYAGGRIHFDGTYKSLDFNEVFGSNVEIHTILKNEADLTPAPTQARAILGHSTVDSNFLRLRENSDFATSRIDVRFDGANFSYHDVTEELWNTDNEHFSHLEQRKPKPITPR